MNIDNLVNFFKIKKSINNNYIFYHIKDNYILKRTPKNINYNIDYKLHFVDNAYIQKCNSFEKNKDIKFVYERNRNLRCNYNKLNTIMKFIIITKFILLLIMHYKLSLII